MIIEERRFEVRLVSPDALRQYMKFRGFTMRSLAKRVGCSHSLIGFLCTGDVKTCRPEYAVRIAEALDCPVESLFAAKVSRVAREVSGVGQQGGHSSNAGRRRKSAA